MYLKMTLFWTAMVIFIFLFVFVMGAQAQEATYVGNTQCKICHNKKEEGEQWNKWKAGPHAKALETLNTDKAKEVAKKLNVAKPPAEAPECLQCHVTAYDAATGKAPEKILPADGVQCESCHGPASNHLPEAKKFKSGDKTAKPNEKIMKGDAKTCVKCHNDKNTTWDPNRYTTADGKKVGFDYDQAYKKIEHSNPLKKK